MINPARRTAPSASRRRTSSGRTSLPLLLGRPPDGSPDSTAGLIARRIRPDSGRSRDFSGHRLVYRESTLTGWDLTGADQGPCDHGVIGQLAGHDGSRKRVEAELARDALLLANVRDSVIVTDMDGIVTYWNEGATRLFGWRAEEMVGRRWWGGCRRRHGPDVVVRARADGEDFDGEWEDYRKDGSRIWIEARVTRIADASGMPIGLMGLAHDISDRKRAEEALRESEERFRLLAESIPHMVWSAGPDGSTDYLNTRFLDYLGVTPGLEGLRWADALHPDDRRRALDAWEHALRNGAEYRIEYRLRNGKTGEYRWFIGHALPQREAGGRIVRWFGTCTDIDHRKRAEQEFRYLLEKLPAAAYMCDPDGLITYFNPQAVDLWGRVPKLNDPEDRFCGSYKLFAANGMPLRHDQCWMALTLRTNQGHNGREIQVEHPDGQHLIGLVFANPIQDESGRLLGAVNVVVDITDRKRAEEALRESEDRLQILSRRVVDVQEEEQSRLARELHDEIGQVLTAIGMNLQAMTVAEDQADQRRLEECRGSVDRAFLQVRDLALDLRPPLLDVLGLAAALRWLVDRQTQRDGLIAHVVAESTARALPSDLAIACYRVAQEALTNVVRHAGRDRSGSNYSTARRRFDWSSAMTASASTRRCSPACRPGCEPRLAGDAGASPAARRPDRHRIRPGAGDHHPGAVPLGVPGLLRRNGSGRPATMKPIRILLADDHDLVRAGIQALLETLPGIEVVAGVGNGREALRLSAEKHPDVVLMDIMMPEMNGLEATARLTAMYPRIRSIILSMNANEEYVLQAMRAGAVGYLVKNVSLAELEQAIRAVAGETYLSPAISKHVIAGYCQRVGHSPLSSLDRLTPRQRETLQLTAEGKTTKEIARLLNLSVKTVEMHRTAVDESTRCSRHRGPGSLCHPDGGHHAGRLAIPTLTDPPPKPRPTGRATTRPISDSRRRLARNLRPRARIAYKVAIQRYLQRLPVIFPGGTQRYPGTGDPVAI